MIEAISLEMVLGAVIAVLGSAITIVSIKHKGVLKEIRELAEVVQESYKDKKITKDEQKEILDEVVDVAHAIASSWSLKK
jgi:hypothetical protein|tara:strand:- start:237 stop:476 length:240 start_codon:yes stop_codon:yes gene_type:complete